MGEGKFFSNGLDLQWMQENAAKAGEMLQTHWKFLARLLTTDCHTVAAVNGHAFGAGFFLAMACDYRIMRTGRGFMNLPEAALGMRLSKAFAELVKAKMSVKALRLAALSGKRFGSSDAVSVGIADAECPVEDLLGRAQAMAAGLQPDALELHGFNPANFSLMKVELYTDAYLALKNGTSTTPADVTPSKL